MTDKNIEELQKEISELKARIKKIEEHLLIGRLSEDVLVGEATKIVRQFNRASASLLQRRLSVGYVRVAWIIDILEQKGIIGPGDGAEPRKVLPFLCDKLKL